MSKHTIPVLEKAIRVLQAVAAGGHTNTKALAQQTGVPHTTVYRILQTFSAEDWIRPAGAGRHELSFGLMPLLQQLMRHELLIETVRPHLRTLAEKTGLAAKLSVRQGENAISLCRADSPRETSISVRVGSEFHLAFGSSGAVLLSDFSKAELRAFLNRAPEACWEHQKPVEVEARVAECRRKGFCADAGGYRPGVHTLSAPVRDRAGELAGVLTIIGFAQDFSGGEGKAHARVLVASAAACSRALRGGGVRERGGI